MIRFVDINTGNVYNGDRPYIHWFEGKQSVGLNYDKQFVIVTDDPLVEVRCDSEVFFLVDNHKIGYFTDDQGREITKEFYDKKFLDLDVLKTNYIYHPKNEQAMEGNYYMYTFNIIACGKYVGEITETFSINGQEFTVGADFVDENEALGINLTNLGTELSNEIQRAIYEKTINEQKVDWVLLNRKFKELLNEYINVIANKGSYGSLINSLNWFEYGDLVKIYEYWKHDEPNKPYLSKRDLTQYLSDELESLLYSHKKTTYIGISAALNKIRKITGAGITIFERNNDGKPVGDDTYTVVFPVEGKIGNIIYENKYDEQFGNDPQLVDEPNPELEQVSMLWSKEEMSLKMTLLGNFFATYFMPIHLDLIHSTIENIVFAQTLKISSFPKNERIDIFDEINEFQCKLNKVYHLSNIETYTNRDTLFGFINRNKFVQEDEDTEIIGVDTTIQRIGVSPLDQLKSYNLKHFKGIGTIIPFECTLYNITGTKTITEANIFIYKNGELQKSRKDYNLKYEIENDKAKINFNILLTEIGKYKVQLEFKRSDGISYLKVFDFIVDEEINQTLEMYRLVPRFTEQELMLNKVDFSKWIEESDDDQSIPFGSIADYVLNPVKLNSVYNQQNEEGVNYLQFISATTKNIYRTVHTNQVVVIKFTSSTLELNNDRIPLVYLQRKGSNKSTLFCDIKDFIWLKFDNKGYCFVDNTNPTEAITEWRNEVTEDKSIYYIGICKFPNIERFGKWQVALNQDTSEPFVAKVWVRDMFIPYFYKLENMGTVSLVDKVIEDLSQEELFKLRNDKSTYEINDTEVICFLPSVKCIRRPKDFMWKFTCMTTNEEICPKSFRNFDMEIVKESSDHKKITPNDNVNNEPKPFPTILQPLFGKYTFRVLPTTGYYNVELSYKMDDLQTENSVKKVSSQFILKDTTFKQESSLFYTY